MVTWYIPKKKLKQIQTSEADADWYNMCSEVFWYEEISDAEKWDKLKLVLAYTMNKVLCEYVAINEFENTPYGWSKPLKTSAEDKEFVDNLLKEAQAERNRYLNHYVCGWSDLNEKFYKTKVANRIRNKYILEK